MLAGGYILPSLLLHMNDEANKSFRLMTRNFSSSDFLVAWPLSCVASHCSNDRVLTADLSAVAKESWRGVRDATVGDATVG